MINENVRSDHCDVYMCVYERDHLPSSSIRISESRDTNIDDGTTGREESSDPLGTRVKVKVSNVNRFGVDLFGTFGGLSWFTERSRDFDRFS